MKKSYPCDNGGDCPYMAEYISTCQFCCGYGVVEDEVEENKLFDLSDIIEDIFSEWTIEEDEYNPDDMEIDWDNVDL